MLLEFLTENRNTILQLWFDQTINTYEPEMIRFLKKEKNQFSNPVRNTIITSLEKIFDGLLSETGFDEDLGLEDIIKVRAVQDFSPSKALSFLFGLKKIIRTELMKSDQNITSMKEISMLDQKFDVVIQKAFDYYNESRMKIHEIKISEIKSRSERAFKMLHKTKPQSSRRKSP